MGKNTRYGLHGNECETQSEYRRDLQLDCATRGRGEESSGREAPITGSP